MVSLEVKGVGLARGILQRINGLRFMKMSGISALVYDVESTGENLCPLNSKLHVDL